MSPIRMGKVEDAMRTGLSLMDAIGKGDERLVRATLAPDCVFESAYPAPDGASYSGVDAIAEALHKLFFSLPGLELTIEENYAMGFSYGVRYRLAWLGADGGREHLRSLLIMRVGSGLVKTMYHYSKA